jgi:gliding motility-associated lipoprotein GldD
VLEFTKKAIRINVCFCLLICLPLLACNKNYKPKPKGYNHINFPERSYTPITIKNKYSFEKNTQTSVEQNDSYGWLNLLYKNYDAKILITHKYIEKENDLISFINESYKLTNKHNKKASSIKETHIKTTNGLNAIIIDLKGEVPTQFQFITTDSVNHFLRGALYFQVATKNDSLAPIIEYIKKDMIHLLNTLEWYE